MTTTGRRVASNKGCSEWPHSVRSIQPYTADLTSGERCYSKRHAGYPRACTAADAVLQAAVPLGACVLSAAAAGPTPPLYSSCGWPSLDLAAGLLTQHVLAAVLSAVNTPGTSFRYKEDGTPVAEECPADTWSAGMKKQRSCVPCVSVHCSERDCCCDSGVAVAAVALFALSWCRLWQLHYGLVQTLHQKYITEWTSKGVRSCEGQQHYVCTSLMGAGGRGLAHTLMLHTCMPGHAQHCLTPCLCFPACVCSLQVSPPTARLAPTPPRPATSPPVTSCAAQASWLPAPRASTRSGLEQQALARSAPLV